MFECLGIDERGHCIAQPHLGKLYSPEDTCEECQGKGFGECCHMKRTEKRSELCACYWIECQCKEAPIHGIAYVWHDKICNQRRCKFFELA